MQYTFSGFSALVWLFAEIAGFIIVGRAIGVLPTLTLIFLSMIVGISLLRHQGVNLLKQVQNQLAAGEVPDREMAEGAMAITGAILLIIPGFISDIIGILLLIPPVRDWLWHFLEKRGHIRSRRPYRQKPHSKRQTAKKTIELDSNDYHAANPENSPWRASNKKNHKE